MKTNRRRGIAALLAALLLAVTACAFVGCGDNELPPVDESTWHSLENNDLVQIEIWGRDTDTERQNYQNFINEFNSTHPNIIANLRWQTDPQAYATALDGRGANLPDVFMLQNTMFISYAASGKLADMRGYLDESVLNDIYEDGYDVYYFDHATKTVGRTDTAALYGLPKDQGPYALCVNETLLRETVASYNASVSAAEQIDIDRVMSTTEPMTFSYFLELGSKLKTQLGSNEYFCSGYDIESAVFSNNAHYFTDDSGRTSAIDSENFIDAIEFVQDLYKEGLLPSAGTVSSGGETVFTSGRSIFYYAGPWKQKEYWQIIEAESNPDRFVWNILPVLCGDAEGAMSTCYTGGMCYAISRNSKYKDAALELVKFLSTDTSSQRTQYKRGQCIPNLISLAEEFSDDSMGLIAAQTGREDPCPANRSVWIDTVNGTSETDKITSKYCSGSYTLDSTWLTNLNQFMSGQMGSWGSFWEQKSDGSWVDVGAALADYKPTMQAALDLNNRRLDRM